MLLVVEIFTLMFANFNSLDKMIALLTPLPG